MKFIFPAFFLIVIAWVQPAIAQQYDFSEVDRLLQDSLLKLGRGAALVLVKDGEVIYSKAFGRYSVDSVVPIASASKWYSGAVIMSLVDEGKLSLDDTVGRFFSGLAGRKGQITIRQLFSHTSGIPGDADCLGNDNTTLAECANEILSLTLLYPPGSMFVYGGSSMQVAGRIAEMVSGMPWDTLFRKRVADPLGMTGTHYDGLGVTDNPRVPGGAASSAADYTRFMTMIQNRGEFEGRRVLSRAAVETMMEDQTLGVPIAYSPYTEYGSIDPEFPQARYGIGMWREKTDNGVLLEAASPGALGFCPWIDLRRGYTGVLSVHAILRNVVPTYVRLKQLLRAMIPENGQSNVTVSYGKQTSFAMEQNHPNPFSTTTSICVHLPAREHVTLKVYDLLGREIATLLDRNLEAGTHAIDVDAEALGNISGTFIYRLATPETTVSRVMEVVR